MATAKQKNSLKKLLTHLKKKSKAAQVGRKKPIIEELVFQVLSDDHHQR